MIRKKMKMSTVLINVLVLIVIIIIPGCNKNANTDSQIQQTASGNAHSEMHPFSSSYTRLLYDHFQQIISDSYLVSGIYINYSRSWNFDEYDHPQEFVLLKLNGSLNRDGDLFSAYSNYNGLYYYTNVVEGFDRSELRHSFTASEVNDLIFDYLEEDDNEYYFFDGNEYANLPTPYETYGGPFVDGDQFVTISFREPGTIRDKWAISKSMFADDPHPILQGLIDILEDEFITQFE